MRCNHQDSLVYVRRTKEVGEVHYAVQCTECLDIVKTERHNFRPYIKHSEIPTGYVIYEFVAGGRHD